MAMSMVVGPSGFFEPPEQPASQNRPPVAATARVPAVQPDLFGGDRIVSSLLGKSVSISLEPCAKPDPVLPGEALCGAKNIGLSHGSETVLICKEKSVSHAIF
jgi:hypothetical protein